MSRYELKPYRTPSDRITCPSCGHRREFSPYIDTETGEILHPSVGRCNREKSCGYHYKPSEYFKDHPEREGLHRIVRASSSLFERRPEPSADYLPLSLIEGEDTRRKDNNLYRFFVSRFGSFVTDRIFDLYRVRTSKHFRNAGGLSAAFPQIDRRGNLRQVKIMAYNPETGKRLHKQDTAEKWSEKRRGYFTDTEQDKIYFAGKYLSGQESPNLQQCFFGEHLIQPGSLVGIVESEKTAMIAAVYQPGMCWIATGGKNGVRLTETGITSAISGIKAATLFPDLGCFEEWAKKKEIIASCGITCTVSDLLERRATREESEAGLDIADFLLRETPPGEQLRADRRQYTETASSGAGIKAYIDDIGHLYIPTPPDGSTFTVYQSIDEYESVRSGATRGHTRAHIERRTGEEHFKEEVWI